MINPTRISVEAYDAFKKTNKEARGCEFVHLNGALIRKAAVNAVEREGDERTRVLLSGGTEIRIHGIPFVCVAILLETLPFETGYFEVIPTTPPAGAAASARSGTSELAGVFQELINLIATDRPADHRRDSRGHDRSLVSAARRAGFGDQSFRMAGVNLTLAEVLAEDGLLPLLAFDAYGVERVRSFLVQDERAMLEMRLTGHPSDLSMTEVEEAMIGALNRCRDFEDGCFDRVYEAFSTVKSGWKGGNASGDRLWHILSDMVERG